MLSFRVLQQSEPGGVRKYENFHNKFKQQNKLLVLRNVLEQKLKEKEKFANENCNIFKKNSICSVTWRDIDYLETTLDTVNTILYTFEDNEKN
jgi:hypothetical protein